MKISRYAGLAGIAFLSLVGLALAQTGTLYQTTPAPKIVHPYWSGLKVATDSDTPLDVTLTDTAVSIVGTLSVTLTDTSINDGGGSITVDNSYLDTALSTRASEATLASIDAKITAVNTGAVVAAVTGSVTATIADSTPTDTWLDVTLTDTATEYSIALPANTIAYEFQCRTAVDIRWGNTGELATKYWTLKSGSSYSTWPLANYNCSGKTLYFKCPSTAGVVIEVHAIMKP